MNKTTSLIVDQYGKPMAFGLYPSPQLKPNNYRPRYYTSVADTHKNVNSGDHYEQLRYGRSMFATLPDLGGSIRSKASWAVGPNSFSPIFTGEDQAWGDIAEKWLVNNFYGVCNIAGNNYDFRTTLYNTSIALDVDGDSLLVLAQNRDGFPLIQIIPSHRIANRDNAETMKGGKFDGYTVINGVIINDLVRPIGYCILGDKPEDDYQISTANCQLLFEADWADQYRGISRIATPLTDLLDLNDIDDYIKLSIKRAVAFGVIHSKAGGQVDTSDGSYVGAEEDSLQLINNKPIEVVNGGETVILNAEFGEKMETFKYDMPAQTTQDYIERVRRGALFSVGWPIELLDPSKVGGASVRLIQDLARRSVASRQVTLEKRAKFIVNFAVTKAMNNSLIPQNNGDWWNWSFTKGAAICVDSGNEANSDREGYKLGSTSLQEISSKKGIDWQELRKQNQKEVEDLLDRAIDISKKKKVPFETALVLLQQNTPNASPVSQPAKPSE